MCPTCSGTMAAICQGTMNVWHCERCGTLKTQHFTDALDPDLHIHPRVYVPKLVERCSAFEAVLHERRPAMEHALCGYWRRFGLDESINPPERRPQ